MSEAFSIGMWVFIVLGVLSIMVAAFPVTLVCAVLAVGCGVASKGVKRY